VRVATHTNCPLPRHSAAGRPGRHAAAPGGPGAGQAGGAAVAQRAGIGRGLGRGGRLGQVRPKRGMVRGGPHRILPRSAALGTCCPGLALGGMGGQLQRPWAPWEWGPRQRAPAPCDGRGCVGAWAAPCRAVLTPLGGLGGSGGGASIERLSLSGRPSGGRAPLERLSLNGTPTGSQVGRWFASRREPGSRRTRRCATYATGSPRAQRGRVRIGPRSGLMQGSE
jgi:hypothetical protein